jgi:hypothetical protein
MASRSTRLIASVSRYAASRGAPPGVGNRRRSTLRQQAGEVQRLDHVDVAQTGDDPLIQQRRLERGALAGARSGQRGGVERVRERLGTERPNGGCRSSSPGGTRSITPKRLGSLKTTSAPESRWKIT